MIYYPELKRDPDPIDDWGTPAPEGHPILGVSITPQSSVKHQIKIKKTFKRHKEVGISSAKPYINTLDVIERAGNLEVKEHLYSFEEKELHNLIELKKSLSHLPKLYDGVDLIKDSHFKYHHKKHDYKFLFFDCFRYWYLEY